MILAVFLDGTWADRTSNTNVAQLAARARAADPCGEHQRVHYDEGVGVLGTERVRGGVFGFGLARNIVEAYRFVAERYREGDRLMLFGFSRGAYSARSLGGMIAHCGIVPPDVLSAHQVFARYRRAGSAPGLLELATGRARSRDAEDFIVKDHAARARIRLIAVFDTVGELGIPLGALRALNRERHGFHDTRLSGLVDEALHAVAVDEKRANFPPTLWDAPPERLDENGDPTGLLVDVRQVWFRGSHANVGGWGTQPERTNRLSVITRQWVADRARADGLGLAPPAVAPDGGEWDGAISDSHGRFLGGFYRYLSRPVLRSVGRGSGPEEVSDAVVTRWRERPADRPLNPGLADLVARRIGAQG